MASQKLTRREAGIFFLQLGWAGLMVSGILGSLASLLFFRPRALFEPATRFFAGRPQDYAVDSVEQKFKDDQKVWIVRDSQGIFAIVAQCTHLGCRPNWFESERKFRCPCHGSIFDGNGMVLSGPAPKPLYRASIQLTKDGRIVVDRGMIADFTEAQHSDQFRITEEELRKLDDHG